MKLIIIIWVLMMVFGSSSAAAKHTTYIAMISSDIHSSHHHSILAVVTRATPIYEYRTAINGFAVSLSRDEADSLAKQPGVISVTPDRVYNLHTTRSPGFLRLAESALQTCRKSFPVVKTDHLVIGFVDSGVWPEHPSFNDTGLGPLPPTWKGACEEGDNFTASSHCNKKLIGARYFLEGYSRKFGSPPEKSARDHGGHGTHTATIAAGSLVQDANMFGLATGAARGMAPDARIAAYKVCWRIKKGCFSSDILAGIDAAINDGVNVLSISLGRDRKETYYDDHLAIGAFSAMAKGIFVTLSAGNSGPGRGSVINVAPWMTTVAASSLDREFPINVTLGNGYNYTGVSLYNDINKSPAAPLVFNDKCETKLNPKLVMGKIVVCYQDGPSPSPWTASTSMKVKNAGGVGLIQINTRSEEIYPIVFFLPTAVMGREAGKVIRSYMDSEEILNATAVILNAATQLGVQPAPTMPSFSSRGPNRITPEILKPDLTAPGVSIIAAWTGDGGPTFYDYDKRRVSFNIASGTSMSCPHVSGLALLLKGAHPEWSPAVIRSALMTTAYTEFGDDDRTPILDRATESPATPYDYGSGHVDPVAALDPGLVYELTEEDYLSFLCALRYTPLQIKKVTSKDLSCDPRKDYSLGDFNYPSFSVVLPWPSPNKTTTTYKRTLTNVDVPSTYTVSVSLDNSNVVNVKVEPSSLTFTHLHQKNNYSITFETTQPPRLFGTIFGNIEWSDGTHKVRSPIVITQKY